MKKIKLIFLHMELVCGGAEKALYDLLSMIDKDIFDITLLTVRSGGVLEQDFLDLGIEVINPFSRLIKSKNIFIRFRNHFLSKKIVKCLDKKDCNILSYIIKDKFDIVISYQLSPDLGFIGLPHYGKKIKYFHENVFDNECYSSIRGELKKICSVYDKIICVSENSKKGLESLIGVDNRIVSVINPLNADEIIRKSKSPIENIIKKPYFCAVGRLVLEKGFDRLINVFSSLVKDGYEGNLLIIGEGSQRSQLETLINNLGLNERVLLAGYMKNPYPYIKNSYALVIPSFTEGLPVVAFEALCLEVPVVSTYSSVKESFGEDECGIVCENNINSLLQSLNKLVKDKEFYSRIQSGAHNRSKYLKSRELISNLEKEYLEMVD